MSVMLEKSGITLLQNDKEALHFDCEKCPGSFVNTIPETSDVFNNMSGHGM